MLPERLSRLPKERAMACNPLFKFAALLLVCWACTSMLVPSAHAEKLTSQQIDIARDAAKAVLRLEQAAQTLDSDNSKRSSLLYVAKLFKHVADNPAEYDSGKALYRLGSFFESVSVEEFGIKLDTFEAIKWYRRAARHDHLQSQYNLGVLYLLEAKKGVSSPASNYNEAARWFKKAAEQDHPVAQFILAILYLEGLGVLRQDETEADKWLTRARQNGMEINKQTLLESLKTVPFTEWDFAQFRD